jgi:zinc protease
VWSDPVKTRLIVLALAVLVAVGGVVGALSTGIVRAPWAETAHGELPRVAVEKYTLPNGLEVILSQDKRLPVVAVNLWYHVGPANEPPGRTGFAHLFEHMMFQSSKHVPQDAHFQLLEAAGASDYNGTTNFDRTNYYETVPANQLELALWLESDRMGYLLDTLDQAALSNQQDVVRNERRETENTPYGLAEERFIQMLFPAGHPYHGNIIGSHDDIQAATLGNVREFFRQYYTPNNASLALVGDFDVAAARALVEKYFGTLRRGPDVRAVTVETAAITSERRDVFRAQVELPRAYMAWITPPLFAPGDADADIVATLLGGGRSSRLYKALVYEKQIAQDVSAWQYSLQLGSVFQITATARPGHTVEELEQAIEEELETLRTAAPAETEVTRARNMIETDAVSGLERVGGLADRLNAYNHYVGTPDYLQQDIERYRAVTPASAHGFVQKYLRPDARVVLHVVRGAVVSNQGGAVSSQKPVISQEGGSGQRAAAAAEAPLNADEPWRATPPQAGPVPTVRLPAPESVTLENGLTLLLDRRTDLPIVAASLVTRTGSGSNPADRPGLAAFVAEMLDEGTATRNALQIADEVAQLGAALTTASSMDALSVSGHALSRNFPALLELMADVTLRPTFPDEELARQRASRLAQLVQARDNPSLVASRVAAAVMFGDDHPYGHLEIGTEASLSAITRDELQQFWREHFLPNGAALVVSGDISMRELREMAERAFGGWEPGTVPLSAPPAPRPTGARLVIVDRPGAPQTQLRVAAPGAPRSSPDFRPMQVMNMALGGLFSSRINMNLREEHGYTYGAGSQFVFRRHGGIFQVATGVRTDVTAPAVGEILKELREIGAEPLRPEELAAAKAAMINSLPGAFETTDDAVANFSNVFVYELGLDYYSGYAADVDAITAERAQTMAQQYLAAEALRVVAVGDRSAIESALRQLSWTPVEIRDAEGQVMRR